MSFSINNVALPSIIRDRLLSSVGEGGKSAATKTPTFEFGVDNGPIEGFSGVDMSKVPPQNRAEVSAKLLAMGDACHKLKGAIKDARSEGNFQKAADLESKLTQLNQGLAEMVYEIEHADISKIEGMAFVMAPGLTMLADMASRNYANVGDINQEYDQFIKLAASIPETGISAPASAAPPTPEGVAGSKKSEAPAAGGEVKAEAKTEVKTEATGESKGTDGTAKTGAKEEVQASGGTGQADEAKEAAGAEGKSKSALASMSGGDIRNMMINNPSKFSAEYEKLSEGDKMAMNTKLQSHLQAMNQLFSMMSNIMKSEHDTRKAVINNMRV